MNNPLEELINICLSFDIDQDVLDIEASKNKIISICKEICVPYAVGLFSDNKNILSETIQQNDYVESIDDFINWIKLSRPEFVVISPMMCFYNKDCDNSGEGMLIKAAYSLGKEKELDEMQKYLDRKVVQFNIYCIFTSGYIKTEYKVLGKTSMFCLNYIIEEDEDFENDEDFEEDEHIQLTYQEVKEKALILAKDNDFYLAKNQQDRRFIAEKLFEDSQVDGYDIDRIVKESAPIYKIKVLPDKIKLLKENGKSAKEIAEATGESLVKIKQIMASLD